MTAKERVKRLIYLALQKYRIVPKDPLRYIEAARRFNFAILYQRIAGVPGCVVELGVSQGLSLTYLKILSLAEGKDRKIYGFDTFEGLPQPLSFERGFKGQFKGSYARVVQFFRDTQTPMDGVTLVPGDIRETLKTFDFKEPIALLHIDLDLYEGYKAGLSLLWDKLSPGAIVIFDDYGFSWAGADKAVDEFLATHPQLVLEKAQFAKKAYIVKPR